MNDIEKASSLIEELKIASKNMDSKKFEWKLKKVSNEIDRLSLTARDREKYNSQIEETQKLFEGQMKEQHKNDLAFQNIQNTNSVNHKNKRFFQKHKALVIAGSIGVFAIGGLSAAVFMKNASAQEQDQSDKGQDTNLGKGPRKDSSDFNTPEQVQEDKPIIESVLPSYLSFDINDNASFIEQSAQFIANSRLSGLDFANEKDIAKFMDFSFVMGLEEIDPVDYACLQYNGKTTQSIIDNYQYCANEIVYDLYSVLPDTILDYPIANKDSKEILMQLQRMIADYNLAIQEKEEKSAKKIADQMEDYFLDNFVEQDGRIYTRATYEFVARMANVVDDILPKGLSKDITYKLSEDLYTCGEKAPKGESNKSYRAQSETSVREMIDDKLSIARDYRYQDVSNLPEIERLTGFQVETEILNKVLEMNIEFVENPEWDKDSRTRVVPLESSVPSVTLPNDQVVAEEEIIDLGLNPETVTSAEYEKAKVKEFEETAKETFETKAEQHKIDAQSAFMDGYNGVQAKYPNDELYMKNYNEGVNSRPSETTKTEYVDVPDQVVDSNSTVTEQGYIESSIPDTNSIEVNSTQEYIEMDATQDSIEVDAASTFIPAEEDTTQDSIEVDAVQDSIEMDTTQEYIESTEEIVIEEGYVEVESGFETSSNLLSKYQALRKMVDTIVANPTYNASTGIFTLGNEVYDVNQKVKRA